MNCLEKNYQKKFTEISKFWTLQWPQQKAGETTTRVWQPKIKVVIDSCKQELKMPTRVGEICLNK